MTSGWGMLPIPYAGDAQVQKRSYLCTGTTLGKHIVILVSVRPEEGESAVSCSAAQGLGLDERKHHCSIFVSG